MTITEAELAQMRTDLESLTLPDTCAILSGTATTDGMGGITKTWGTVSASVACRLDARVGHEQLGGDAIRPYHEYILTVPQATSITEEQRVVYGSTTYSVVSVSSGSWLACKRVILEKI
jgi:head-tail adaptor